MIGEGERGKFKVKKNSETERKCPNKPTRKRVKY